MDRRLFCSFGRAERRAALSLSQSCFRAQSRSALSISVALFMSSLTRRLIDNAALTSLARSGDIARNPRAAWILLTICCFYVLFVSISFSIAYILLESMHVQLKSHEGYFLAHNTFDVKRTFSLAAFSHHSLNRIMFDCLYVRFDCLYVREHERRILLIRKAL